MSLKEDATTVAVLKALRDIVDAEYEAARQRVFAGLCEVRDETGLKSIRVTLPDDTPVATISLIDPKPAIAVSDEKAFLGWVREYYPSEVETLVRVRPAWQRNFISGLDASSDLVTDASTGENVRGLDAVPAPEPRSFALRSLPGGSQEIVRAWRRGDLDLRRTLFVEGAHS
jgi:hypothetical protein